jgi:hypothetical protein
MLLSLTGKKIGDFLSIQADFPKTIALVAKNVPTAANAKITVLTGVNEQNALYPSKHSLLASTAGDAVLKAARLKKTITAITNNLVFCIISSPSGGVFSIPLHQHQRSKHHIFL